MEQYFSDIHEKNPFIFIGLAFVASLIPSVFMLSFVDAPDLKNGQLSVLGNLFPYFVIFLIPVLETIVCQAFPALLIDIFSLAAPIRILVITLPFAFGHIIPDLPLPSFINGISGGLILGICYLVCQRKSHYYAILVTIFVHAAHNAVALALGD
jgi:hypothetical protein